MGDFDLTREVAEKVLKRAMTPVRGRLEAQKESDLPDDNSMSITFGELKELDRDLGVLGLTLATRYAEQVEYQTALAVMSAENVRLHTAAEVLSEMLEKVKQDNTSLASALAKTQNVNNKLKELHVGEKPGFHANEIR